MNTYQQLEQLEMMAIGACLSRYPLNIIKMDKAMFSIIKLDDSNSEFTCGIETATQFITEYLN